VFVLIEFLHLVFRHREGINWCPAPLRDEDQCNYKVNDVADVQAAPVPPVNEYVSDSTVGSDNEAPATSRRVPSKVVAPQHTRQTAGKMPTFQAATQAAEAKKRKRKRTRSVVSADTTTISFDVETINVDDGEGDVESPKATTAPSLGKQAVVTSRQASKTQGRPTLSIDPVSDLGSHKRAKKVPPKLTALQALKLLLIQVFPYQQSSLEDVGERQECLRPRGI
jgi:hypothetical protein